jgi:hypothetical protein
MAIQTDGLFTLLERPGDLIPVMLDALELALRSQQLPIRNQSIRIDSNVRQIRLIKLSSDETIQMTSDEMVINKNSPIEGLDYYPWQANIFKPNFDIQHGELIMPHKPGWGIELDAEWLSRADHKVSYCGDRF